MHGLLTMVFDIRLEQKNRIAFSTSINLVQFFKSMGLQIVLVLLFNDKSCQHNNSIHSNINLVNLNA